MRYLTLGVVDVPYENDGERPAPRITKKGRVHKTDAARLQREQDGHDTTPDGPTTTARVATILEDQYGVMQVFYDTKKEEITGFLVDSLEGALEDLYAGAPATRDPFAQAGQKVAASFRHFLMTGEIEHLGVEGVPTQAAIERRSLRFKNKVGPNRRPSFIDTGTYEASMRAWMEDE